MNTLGAFFLIAVVVFILIVPVGIGRRRALQRYWDRHCTGIRWRRRFPDAPKTELREFLTIFVDAFCYEHKRRTCFSPDDRLMDVYRADYPHPWIMADSMELETLGLSLEERYGVDFDALWREDITLRELYEHTRRKAFYKRGAGKGGFAGLWRAGRAWPALHDRERWARQRFKLI
jgi:propanediol dehydratase small subunit